MAASVEESDGIQTRFFWDDASIKNLLLIARQYQLSDVDIYVKQKFFFDMLEQGMQQLGFPLNKAQIRRKWKSMRDRYYYIKGHPQEFPAKSKWEYMNLMEQLLSGYPQIDGNDFEHVKLPPPAKLQKISENMENAISGATEKLDQMVSSGSNAEVASGFHAQSANGTGQQQALKNHIPLTGGAAVGIQTQENPRIKISTSLADKVNDPDNNIGDLLERITADEHTSSTSGQCKGILDTTDSPAEDTLSPSASIADDTNDGTDEPPTKLPRAEVNINGTTMKLFGDSFLDPLRPKRKRKGETNTDRIIAAMEAEGEKDRKILLQFMNEFSTSAAALTEAIKQITSHSDEEQEADE